eukprot:4150700-Amphidinium_carterae.3
MNDPDSLMCILPVAGGEIWLEDAIAGTSVEQDELGRDRQGTWHAYSRVFLFSATKRHIVRAAEGSCTLVLYLTRRTPSVRDAAKLAQLGFVLPLSASSSDPGTEPSHYDAGAASSEAPLADPVDDEEAEVEVMVHRRAYQRVDERGEDVKHSAPPFGFRVNRNATIAEVRTVLRKRLKLSPHRLILKAFSNAAVLVPDAQVFPQHMRVWLEILPRQGALETRSEELVAAIRAVRARIQGAGRLWTQERTLMSVGPWIRDLTQEGVEPNPGPAGTDFQDKSERRKNQAAAFLKAVRHKPQELSNTQLRTLLQKDKLCEVVLSAAESEISAHLEQARGKHLKGKDAPPQKDVARQKSVARFELDAVQNDVQLGVQIPEAWLDRIMSDPECSLEDMAAEVKSYLEANLVAAAEALLDIQDKESMDMCRQVKIKDVIIMTKRDGW